jgi:glycerol-3-phosphate dehydrogenase (NAD(P)+)
MSSAEYVYDRGSGEVNGLRGEGDATSREKGAPQWAADRRAGIDVSRVWACDAVLVTPAQHMRRILGDAPVGQRPPILCSKGIEADSMALMSEAAKETCPGAPIAVLSGPKFASEVAKGLPTAVTLACADDAVAAGLAQRIARPVFPPHRSTDVIGAEMGGAVKNGMSGLGDLVLTCSSEQSGNS